MKKFDIVAVNLDTNKVRMIAESKSERSAEAIEEMAVMRRGVEDEFFAAVSGGSYKNGDEWVGVK